MRTVDPEQHRARREHILHAAAGLFATKGFDATRTAEICRAAEISTGTLFHYFSSKRDVFIALLRLDRDETERAIEEAHSHEDPRTALFELIDHLAAAATEPVAAWLVLEAMLQARRDPELAELLGGDSADEQAAIVSLLERLQAEGRIDPSIDPPVIGAWIMDLIGATYLAALDDADGPGPLALLRATVERLLFTGPSS